MTSEIMSSEGSVWIVAVSSTAAAGAALFWIAMQAVTIWQGHRPHLSMTPANSKQFKQIVCNQRNPVCRRWYTLLLYGFCVCMAILVTGMFLSVTLFCISAVWE